MTKRIGLICAFFTAFLWTHSASASFIGNSIDASLTNTFDTVFDDTATVGEGVEFSGTSLFYTYTLDFTATAFTLTISKPFSAGNYTGILERLEITGIETDILDVTLDTAISSAFSSNTPNINFSDPGSIVVFTDLISSANSPASARSHSFTWNVDFDSVAVANAPMLALFVLGFLGLALNQRRRLSN